MQETIMRDKLIAMAKEAMQYAYTPYSHFQVGAAILCEDGSIYTGCNIENSSYGATNCAERTAAFKAVSEGHRVFSAIAVVCSSGEYAYPCGICRQVIGEFMKKDGMLYLTDEKEGELSIPFFDAMPYFFDGERIK